MNPLLAAAHFQLYNLYRTAGRQPDAARELATFQQLKKDAEGAAVPEDVDWCNFAEIYDPPRQPAAPPRPPPPRFDDKTLGPATGMLAIDSTGTGQTDLLVWSPTGSPALPPRAPSCSPTPASRDIKSPISVAAGDFDNDGLMDLCVLTDAGPLLYRNVKGRFQLTPARPPQAPLRGRRLARLRPRLRSRPGPPRRRRPALLRNQGAAGFADRTADFPFAAGHPTNAFKLRVDPRYQGLRSCRPVRRPRAVLYRDQLGGRYTATPFSGPPPSSEIIGDFRARIVDGNAHVLDPARPVQQSLDPRPARRRQEPEAGAGRRGRDQGRRALPEAACTRACRCSSISASYTAVDMVRITWPNGLIQNETNQAANKTYKYKEAQRLSGSCPMIWTWNGREFEFITDVLGVAPLGASDGEGTYFPVDHDEYVQIPARR